MSDMARELRLFNEERRRQFGRGPRPDERLPVPFSGRGADLPLEPTFDAAFDAAFDEGREFHE